jgi:hypothetical protein
LPAFEFHSNQIGHKNLHKKGGSSIWTQNKDS